MRAERVAIMTLQNLGRPRAEFLPRPSSIPGAAKRLRGLLRNAGFTFGTAVERLGIDYRMWTGNTSTRDKVKAYLAQRPNDRFDIFLRFFTLCVPTDPTVLLRWMTPQDIELLRDMNLAVPTSDGCLISPMSLFECRGQFIATDSITNQTEDFNFVMPLLPESYEFAASTPRAGVDATLDLCTGSGVHALLAAQHSRSVCGVDISPRAIAFSRFNLWLNDARNVTFEQGDLFAPVQGRTFDLILANPPYEPVPQNQSKPGENYYCGGPMGDAITSRIFCSLEHFLRPNGVCQVIHMMVSFDGGTHEQQARKWLGRLSDECSVGVISRPITFRSETICGATAVEFGITSIKRHANGQGHAFPQQHVSAKVTG